MAHLEVYADCETERQVTLGDVMSFGRHTDNDVILADCRVSREHARITRHGEAFFLEDLSSSNGTFLRQQRLSPGTPSEFVDGDEIRIGRTRLIFRLYRFISSSSEMPRPMAWIQNPPQPVSDPQALCPHPLVSGRQKKSLSELLNSPIPMPTLFSHKEKRPSKLSA